MSNDVGTNRAYEELEQVLKIVMEGQFIQIERHSDSEKHCVSQVALRYTGDKKMFAKRIRLLLDDACEALTPNQRITIRITGD